MALSFAKGAEYEVSEASLKSTFEQLSWNTNSESYEEELDKDLGKMTRQAAKIIA
jgi:hypothetical protein